MRIPVDVEIIPTIIFATVVCFICYAYARNDWGAFFASAFAIPALFQLAVYVLRGHRAVEYLPLTLFAMLVSFLVGTGLALLRWRPTGKVFPYPSCSNCEYNLTGNISGVCPECGAHI